MRSVPHLASSALVTLLALAACGPAQRTRLGTEQTDVEIEAPAPAVPRYETAVPPGAAVSGGGDSAAVAAGVAAASSARGVTLTGDPRLATLAEWTAARLDVNGDPPPSEVTEFFARNLGLVEPAPHILVMGLPDHIEIADHVESSVSQFLARQTYTHWGATIIPRSGVWLVVVVLSWRFVELELIERVGAPGVAIPIRGTLAAGYRNPSVVVQSPDGSVERLPAGAGPTFDVRAPTGGAGAYQVEILARGPHGDSVIANVPVYLGVEPPRSVRIDAPQDSSGGAQAQDVGTVADELFRLLNEERASAGLPPVLRQADLDAVALAHSQDMVAHDFLGHTSPTTGTAADRVRGAGLTTGLVLENIGRGYSGTEIHRGLLDSPGHRANLINPHATHVGIGVVAQQEGGRVAFIATQVFIRQARAIDVAAGPEEVLTQLNQVRSTRGAPAMVLDPNLQEAAAEAAQAFFAEPTMSQQDTVDRASQALRRFSIQFRRIGGVMAVVYSLDEATQLEPALDATVTRVGIGIAQGTREDTGPNAIAVVIVLGWER